MKLINFLSNLSLIFLGFLFVLLKFFGSLTFYIRPEQEVFTVSMGVVLIICGLWLAVKNDPEHMHGETKLYVVILAIVFVIGGIFMPRKSLSADTAKKRGTSQNLGIGVARSNSGQKNVSPLLGKIESANYSIADWHELFKLDPVPETYEGQDVSVIGFIEPDSEQSFKITRFVMTCCIVDAYPISLSVEGSYDGFKKNDWVRVGGKFSIKQINGKNSLVVSGAKLEKIPDPGNPYF